MDAQEDAKETHPCGRARCPIRQEVIPRIRSGETPSTDRLADPPNDALVKGYCLRCTVWGDDEDVRRYGAEWDLRRRRREGEAGAAEVHRDLRDAKRLLETPDLAETHVLQVLRRLADARESAREAEILEAVEPLVERRIKQLFLLSLEDPDVLLGLAGSEGEATVSDGAWARYLERLESRAEAEGGALERVPPKEEADADGESEENGAEGPPELARVRARDQTFAVVRGGPDQTGRAAGRVVIVTKASVPEVVRAAPEAVDPVVVRLPPGGPAVRPVGNLPRWARHLLSPRPTGELVADVRSALASGSEPPLSTEPFITADRYKARFTAGALAGAFRQLEEEGYGVVRDVPGVGLVLVSDW